MKTKFILFIFLFSLILRVGFILTLDNSVDVWGDWWDELGWKIATGKGYWVENPYFKDGEVFYAWRSPGFPLFLAFIYKIFGHSYLIAKIGLAILSALTGVLLYLLADFLIDKRKSVWIGIIYSIYPAAIFWTGYLAPETLTCFLVVTSIFFLYKVKESKKIMDFVILGISSGYLAITRPIFLLILPLIFLVFFLLNKNKFPKIGFFLPFLLFILFPFGWGLRNFKIFNKFVLTSTEGGIVFFIANNIHSLSSPTGFYHAENVEEFKNLSELEIDKLLYRKTFKFIKENPQIYLKLVIHRFLKFWRFYPHTISGPGSSYTKFHQVVSFLSEGPIIVLGFLGFLISFKNWRKYIYISILIFLYTFFNVLIRTTIRYRFPLMGFLIILSFYTIETIIKKNEREYI